VRGAVEPVGLELADPDSQISVARIALPEGGPNSAELYRDLVRRGVHVLPCPPFYWADPKSGLRSIRISLARPHDTVRTAAAAMVEAYLARS